MTLRLRKIYATGYTGRRAEDLPMLIETLNAILIDVRFSPGTREITWTRDYLKLLLKNRYRHVGALGERQFRAGKAQAQNAALGIKIIERLEMNAVLMCSCADLYKCHRLILMSEFRKRNFAVTEIESWKVGVPSLF